MREVCQISIDLFQQWDANNIEYCHWKSNEHLFEGLAGDTDLDVLVRVEDRFRARNILKDVGYIFLESQYGSRYMGVEDWLNCDPESGRLIHIHLHYRMATGHRGMKEYSLPWATSVLENRILFEKYNVYICPPDYEIVSLYTRIGLKASFGKIIRAKTGKFRISKDDLREINFLKERINMMNVKSIVSEFYKKDGDEFLKLIGKEELDSRDLLILVRLVTKYMKNYSSIKGWRAVMNRLYFSLILPARNIIRRKYEFPLINKKTFGLGKGAMIAFLGQDGAGKTTVTEEVEKWLSWKVDVRKYYLGSGDNHFSWRKRLSHVLKSVKNPIAFAIRGILMVEDLKRLSKSFYRKILAANKYANKGGIALFDRYPQMQFKGINDGPKIRTEILPHVRIPVIKWYVEHCANVEERNMQKAIEIQPDFIIKLLLDPAISIQRKPLENIENIQRKHKIIWQLEFPDSEAVIVDANQEYNKEIILIHNYIWDFIRRCNFNSD